MDGVNNVITSRSLSSCNYARIKFSYVFLTTHWMNLIVNLASGKYSLPYSINENLRELKTSNRPKFGLVLNMRNRDCSVYILVEFC